MTTDLTDDEFAAEMGTLWCLAARVCTSVNRLDYQQTQTWLHELT